ncbi:MAG: polyprenyl synthetase family protein [Clostridia bacterium]|nr:polyprenyl synthetase family protein [Clostridia bacterium]
MVIDLILKEHQEKIENKINQLFPEIETDYSLACDAARYSLLLGGKRIRPIILLEFYKLCGGNDDKAENFAVALEMIHTYSLIHDDLPCMDNDDMRRGKPSCHKKFGEDIALLAGDTLLTTAFSVAASSGASPDRAIKAIGILADSAGLHGMIGGQVCDISFEKSKPAVSQLEDMYKRKTGALLCAAAEIGCVLAGADVSTVKTAAEYAENLGLAFQIIDDILDCTADQLVLGKPVGSDEKNNKTTFVSIFGLERSRQMATELTEAASDCLDRLKGDTTVLRELTKKLLVRSY